MRSFVLLLLLSVVSFSGVVTAQDKQDNKNPDPVKVDGKFINENSWHYYNEPVEEPEEKEEEKEGRFLVAEKRIAGVRLFE